MADLVRGGLFLLALSATIASSVLWVGPLRLGGTGSLLAIWIAATGQVIVLAQALSLLHALDWPGFLVGHLVILSGTVVWAWRRPSSERWLAWGEIRSGLWQVAAGAWDTRVPALPLLAAATLAAGLIGAIVALAVPPNNWDALSYHMPRVGYYLQFRSLDHYLTDDWRQVVFPANAEIAILWTVAFLRSDRLANAVQLAAWVFAAVAIYGLGRRAGLGLQAALLGAGAFTLLPQPIRQSTNAQNDLLVAAFLVTSLVFLLQAAQARRPMASLTFAGAATGLALGTKWTALLALPGLAAVFLLVFCRRLDRQVLTGLLLGATAAALLGSYFYVQNWLHHGAPVTTGSWGNVRVQSSESPRQSADLLPVRPKPGAFVANLARTLFQGAFADLSGPLSDPRLQPVTAPLAQTITVAGQWLFAALGIPTVIPGSDLSYEPAFTFANVPVGPDAAVGLGIIGGLILIVAPAVLVWPGRVALGRRAVALASLSYMLLLSLILTWSPWGSPRYLLPACAMAAPLLGLAVRWSVGWGRALALILVAWSAATGLYVARVGETKTLSALAGQDRLGLMLFSQPSHLAFFRAVDQELGPSSTVGVYADAVPLRPSFKDQWEYPFFGARFSRTVVPLVETSSAGRTRLRQPLGWSNGGLLAAYRPDYVAAESSRSLVEVLPEIGPGQCFTVPLAYGGPVGAWKLWRCRDEDPRSVLENGDFRAWPAELPLGWDLEVVGERQLAVSRVEQLSGDEPFRLRLDYRRVGPEDEGGIVQEAPVGALRGRDLVVDARVRANREGAAFLWVDDGVGATEVANRSVGAETLRLVHRVGRRATGLWIGLGVRAPDQDAVVLVRTILAIPR